MHPVRGLYVKQSVDYPAGTPVRATRPITVIALEQSGVALKNGVALQNHIKVAHHGIEDANCNACKDLRKKLQ